MIKPSELRIGNLVYDFDENHNQVVKRTYHINENYIKIETPIPLTEEWLLKFGFKKRDEPCFDNHNNSYEIESWGAVSIRDGKLESDEYYFLDGLRAEIRYVHQLQNLYYALTGEELVIGS